MRGDESFLQVAKRAPFSKLRSDVATFFKEPPSREEVASFVDRVVLNTHPIPPRHKSLLAGVNLTCESPTRTSTR